MVPRRTDLDLDGSTLRIEARGRHGLEVRPAPSTAGTRERRCGWARASSRRRARGYARGRREPVPTPDGACRRAAPRDGRIGRDRRRPRADPVEGPSLRGIAHVSEVPSAQVKGAVLLAGLDAEGATTVDEPVATRDHTERALLALGAPVKVEGTPCASSGSSTTGFSGGVPGDVSSAAFLVAAAAFTGGTLEIAGVGLNPTRTAVPRRPARMGVRTQRDRRGRGARRAGGDPPVDRRRSRAGDGEGRGASARHRRGAVLAVLAAYARGTIRGSWARASCA